MKDIFILLYSSDENMEYKIHMENRNNPNYRLLDNWHEVFSGTEEDCFKQEDEDLKKIYEQKYIK